MKPAVAINEFHSVVKLICLLGMLSCRSKSNDYVTYILSQHTTSSQTYFRLSKH